MSRFNSIELWDTLRFLLFSLAVLGALHYSQFWLSQDFYYRRDAIYQGELWRLISAHFVHINGVHLLLNWLGWCFALLLFPAFLNWRLSGPCLLASSVGISLGLYLFFPNIQWYCGFSGVLHSLLVVASLLCRPRRLGGLILLLLSLKMIYEVTGGSLSGMLTETIESPLYEAHWLGYALGFPLTWLVKKLK